MLWGGFLGSEESGNFPDARQLEAMAADDEDPTAVLGKGSFGVVYKLRIEGADYAVKVVTNSVGYAEDEEDLFHDPPPAELMIPPVLMELIAFRALQRVPNVAQLRRVYMDSDHTYLLMDYYPFSLSDAIRDQGYSVPGDFRAHFHGLLRGLRNMHARGIVHNDIKPANILLSADSKPYYSDFGISALVSCDSRAAEYRRGATTAAFSAPEESVNNMVSKSSDVFSLAVTVACYLGGVQGPRNDSAHYLAELNRVTPAAVAGRLKAGNYGALSTPITVEYLLHQFVQEMPLSKRRAQAAAKALAMETLARYPGTHQFLNRMLLTDPERRPSLEDQQWGVIDAVPVSTPPRAGDFLRCYPEEQRFAGMASLGSSMNRAFEEAAEDGVVYALTLDLASRFGADCYADLTLSEYLWLCFAIVEKAHFSRFHSAQDLAAVLKIPRAGVAEFFERMARSEHLMIVRSDFTVFSCALDRVREQFASVPLRDTVRAFLRENRLL